MNNCSLNDEECLLRISRLLSVDNDEYRLKLLNRYETWEKIANEIISEYSSSYRENVLILNEGLLFLAAKSYLDDVYKFKLYSGSKRINKYKIAGYTFKWLSKIKPIQFVSDIDQATNVELQINNLFAIDSATSALEISKEDIAKLETVIKELLYNSIYRNISGKNYSLSFRLLEENIKFSRSLSR